MGKKERAGLCPAHPFARPTSALRLLSSRALSSGWVEGSIANLFPQMGWQYIPIKLGKILNEATISFG